MPEVDRTQMLRVLAEKGRGWRVHSWKPDITFETVLVAVKPNGNTIYLNSNYAPNWDPFTDGRAAFELLEAMRRKPLDVWNKFCGRLEVSAGSLMARALVRNLTPALIAQAAYEALAGEASHG